MTPQAEPGGPQGSGGTGFGAQSGRERLVGLDVFRGATVAGMLLVNDPGTWSAVYPPLEHSVWHGWTPTDLVFPFFLFIVGITTEISLGARRARGDDERAILLQIVKRGSLIFLFGLLLNAFPFYTWPPALEGASFAERVVDSWQHWRIMGVLQRIGIAYVFGALFTFHTGTAWRLRIPALLLFGYWALMTLVPVPGVGLPGHELLDKPDQLLSAWLDRRLLGVNHLWSGTGTWDPEGLLSTLPAIGTVVTGSIAGRWLLRRDLSLNERIAGLFAVGSMAMAAGLVWNWVFPINKGIWTSSYVVFTSGMAAVTLATCLWMVDGKGWQRGTLPFVVYGINPMLAFLGSELMARIIYSVWSWETASGTRITAQEYVFNRFFLSLLPPREASLAFAVSFVALWFLVLHAAWKRGFILKV